MRTLFCLWLCLASLTRSPAETNAQQLVEDKRKQVAQLSASQEESLTLLAEKTRADVRALLAAAEKREDFSLWLWAHWVAESQEKATSGAWGWLALPQSYPPELERLRRQRREETRRVVEAVFSATDKHQGEARTHFEEHVRTLVRANHIEEAKRAREIFSGYEDLPEVQKLLRLEQHVRRNIAPHLADPNNITGTSKPKATATILFRGDNPAFLAFRKRVTAVSSGHYGLKTTGIQVEGVPGMVGKRGLNLLALEGGNVLLRETFDTYRVEEESGRFAQAVDSLPLGTMIVVVVHGDATRRLNAAARAGLRSLGAGKGMEELEYRNAYVLVGLKGMQPGEGWEAQGFGESVHPAPERLHSPP